MKEAMCLPCLFEPPTTGNLGGNYCRISSVASHILELVGRHTLANSNKESFRGKRLFADPTTRAHGRCLSW